MNFMRIKPQNRSRIIVLGILSAGWSLLDPATHFSFTELLIGSILFLILVITLGNFTNYLLRKAGLDFRQKTLPDNILDMQERTTSARQSEDEKDRWALNYGIVWALVLVILTLVA
jgi:hypothetical protein